MSTVCGPRACAVLLLAQLALLTALPGLVLAGDAPGAPSGAPAVRTGFVETNGARLYYEDAGQGRPLVLLHGGLLDRRMWDAQFLEWAKRFRVVRYDARSHGLSETGPERYSPEADLQALIDALQLERPVLVGMSLGGRVAIDFAVSNPEEPAALVLVGPGLSGYEFKDAEILAAERQQEKAAHEGDAAAFVEAYQRAWTDGPKRTPKQVDPAVREKVGAMARNSVAKFEGSGPMLRLDPPAIGRLREIQAPVLLVLGALDAAGIHEIAALIEKQVPRTRQVVIPGAGHAVNMEKPGEFDAAVLEFLGTLPAPALTAGANFYEKSLHFTNRGIAYWYAKEQGGLERLTGLTVDQMGCMKAKCHVKSCDVCHRVESAGQATYAATAARAEQACPRCHAVDPENKTQDVHAARGMTCTSCHGARDLHGDGVRYDSCLQDGAVTARCESCHPAPPPSRSHTVHAGKLDCTACHTHEYWTCVNCHVDTRLQENRDESVLLDGMYFLVNRRGKVTLGNFLSYVYSGRTMITFAPWFSHSVMKPGRPCESCLAAPLVREAAAGRVRAFWWENGAVTGAKGVIPVVDGVKWDIAWLDRADGKWVPLTDPPAPLVNYSGWCSPLTPEQLGRLAKPAPR